MKTKIILVSSLMLMVFIMPLKSSGQDTLTNGEVYDFEVGDVFHTTVKVYSFCSLDYYHIINKEVIDKYYTPENDTLFYVYDVARADSGYAYPNWNYEYYTETVQFVYLNTKLSWVDLIYTDPNLYNGRVINQINDSSEYSIISIKCVEGCGVAEYTDYNLTIYNYNETKLIYYNKGGEEWGTPLLVGEKEIELTKNDMNVFPNPTTSYITIDIKEGIPVEQAIIYNHLGQKALVAIPVKNTVDVSTLKPGIYILEVVTENRIIREKLLVE